MPLRLRKILLHLLHLISKCWRRERPRQNANSRAALCFLSGDRRKYLARECAPIAVVAQIHHILRAVGIIKVKQRRLGKNIGRSERRLMAVVAFNFYGAIFAAGYQQWLGVSTKRKCRRVKLGDARSEIFGLANIRNDRLEGLLGA